MFSDKLKVNNQLQSNTSTYVKDRVYASKTDDITMLKTLITQIFEHVMLHTLARVWQNTEYPFELLGTSKGAHLEIY